MKYMQFEYEVVDLGESKYLFEPSNGPVNYPARMAGMWDTFVDSGEVAFDVAYYTELLKAADVKSPGRTLEIGCRTGSFAVQLADANHKVLSIDPCEAMLDILRNKKRNESLLQIEHTDFDTFETSERFSGIVTFHIIPFFLEMEYVVNFLAKARRLLQKNGIFLLAVNDPLPLWDSSGWSLTYTQQLAHGFARCEHFFEPVNARKRIVRASDYRAVFTQTENTSEMYTKLVRFYTVEEYKYMLNLAGFNTITVNKSNLPVPQTDDAKLYISATK